MLKPGRFNYCEGITNTLTALTASKNYSLLLLSLEFTQFTFRQVVGVIHFGMPKKIQS